MSPFDMSPAPTRRDKLCLAAAAGLIAFCLAGWIFDLSVWLIVPTIGVALVIHWIWR
jgi:Flp pilus assembly protein TadB